MTNCTYCNRAFKYESSRQRHEQMDCRAAGSPAYEGARQRRMNETQRIERRDVRRERRLNEVERIEAIDRLADKLLDDPQYDETPATEVWDIAAYMIDHAG